MSITYISDDKGLKVEAFLNLVNGVWPGNFKAEYAAEAINKTINMTAWDKDRLVGCARLLTDEDTTYGQNPKSFFKPDYSREGKYAIISVRL